MRTEKEIKDKKGGLLPHIKKNGIEATMEDACEIEDGIRSNPGSMMCGYDTFKIYQKRLRDFRIKKNKKK